MVQFFNGYERCGKRALSLAIPFSSYVSIALLSIFTFFGLGDIAIEAQEPSSAQDGVYTEEQANRGQVIYQDQCAICHGETLEGSLAPPLAGSDFLAVWESRPLVDLLNKIQNTMPENAPGQLTRQQASDIVAHVLQVSSFPSGITEFGADNAGLDQLTLSSTSEIASQPLGNLAQVMRGILFPSSNIIFNVQTNDPGADQDVYEADASGNFSWVDWGAGIYSRWQLVDYAAVAIAESAPLLLVPGRRCENGKPVPVERDDWIQFTAEMVEAGEVAYEASQSRNQDAVSEATNQLADSCFNCHIVYRDKPGGVQGDPSNKAARCVP